MSSLYLSTKGDYARVRDMKISMSAEEIARACADWCLSRKMIGPGKVTVRWHFDILREPGKWDGLTLESCEIWNVDDEVVTETRKSDSR